MAYSDFTAYQLDRDASLEEACHVLVALRHGHTVLSVSLDPADESLAGETALQWSHDPRDLATLFRENPASAERLTKGAYATIAAPSWYLKEVMCEHDASRAMVWQRQWPKEGKAWTQLTAEASTETMAWIGLPETQDAIGFLAADLRKYRSLNGAILRAMLLPYKEQVRPTVRQRPVMPTPAATAPRQPMARMRDADGIYYAPCISPFDPRLA